MPTRNITTMGSLAGGASLILVDRFSASPVLGSNSAIRRHHIQLHRGHAGHFVKAAGKSARSRASCASGLWTSAFNKELQDTFEARFGITILTGYALTECVFGTIQPLYGLRKPRSIGRPRFHPDFENAIRIVDEQGKDLPPGQTGEIIISNPTVTPGYFKNPKETARVIRNGWLHTGDNAYRDEDNYFYFIDRKKDVIDDGERTSRL